MMCLKSWRKEKNSMGSLEPAAIRFTLERLVGGKDRDLSY